MISSTVIHHWDSDGVCSAALIMKHEDISSNLTPPIGEFVLDKKIEDTITKCERVYFVDLNITDAIISLKLKINKLKLKKPNKIIFIDHHIQKPIKVQNIEYINPVVAKGKYVPSATWVVSEIYNDWNFLSLLGAVGDIGFEIFEINEFKKKVEEILKKEKASKKDIIQAVKIIDANYILMDRKGVEEIARFLKDATIYDIFKEKWIKKLKTIENEIEKATSCAKIYDDVVFVKFKSKYAIISKVTREFVWNKGFKVCISVNMDFNGKYQVYVRMSENLKEKAKMRELIDGIKKLGINAGGKDEVMGCFFEANEEKLKTVLKLVFLHLSCHLGIKLDFSNYHLD